MCSEIAWNTMNICSEISDWCVALLRGTFGEEKAMLYRVKPRFQDLQAFPSNFLQVAKSMYFENKIIRDLPQKYCNCNDLSMHD